MKNSQNGSVAYFVLIIIGLLILGGGGYYFFMQNKNINSGVSIYTPNKIENSSVQYKVYKNTVVGYSLELPASWKIHSEGTDIFVFPKINTGDSIESLYENNEIGLTISAMTPSSKAKLDDFYSRFYKNLKKEIFSPESDIILEVKSGNLDVVDADHPAYKYQGQQYAIKTNKRVYAVNIFYRDAKYVDGQKSNIAKIIETLQED